MEITKVNQCITIFLELLKVCIDMVLLFNDKLVNLVALSMYKRGFLLYFCNFLFFIDPNQVGINIT